MIYFPASSHPVFKNNHGCLSVMQSLQYKNLCKAVSRARQREKRQKKPVERQTKEVGKE